MRDLADPTDADHGIDLRALAQRSVETYARYKADRKSAGSVDIAKLPGVNHPVFKDKPVNHDPREVFVAELCERRGEYNVFHMFYRALVQALFDAGVSRNVYCVNVDAVIAALAAQDAVAADPGRSAVAARARDAPRSRSSCIRGCSGARPRSTIT